MPIGGKPLPYSELDWPLLYKVDHALLVVVFLALGALHTYWAFGGIFGQGSAIPTVEGKPTFKPGFWMTMAVAAALFLVATALLTMTTSAAWLRLPSLAAIIFTSVVLALRAIGDFKLVGFFKLQSGSRFAQMDTWFYSPLCLVLAVMLACLIFFDSGS